jgi:hypothetical protein
MLERLGWLEGKLDADEGKIDTNMNTFLETLEACLEKVEALTKAGQEQVGQHYKWVPCVKAVHLSTDLLGWASDVLYGAPKE